MPNKELEKPRVRIHQEVIHKKITDEVIWVNCVLKVENLGIQEVDFTTGKVWLELVVPVPETLSQAIETKTLPFVDAERAKNGFYSYEFPYYGEVIEFDFTRGGETPHGRDIQPGEIEQVEFDFFVPAHFEVVGFFTFVQNFTRQGPWGWGKTTYHNLTSDNI